MQVPKGLRVTRVQPARRAPRGQAERLARRAHRERRATLAPPALPARPAPLAPSVPLDRPDKMVKLARWGLLERLVRRDRLDLRVSQGHRGPRARPPNNPMPPSERWGPPGRRVPEVLKETLGLLDLPAPAPCFASSAIKKSRCVTRENS